MVASVGGAASLGLEAGLGMGMRMRAQQNVEEQTRRANLIQDQTLQRQSEADKRLEDDRALDAITKEMDDLRAEGEGYAAQYGPDVPEEFAAPFKQRQESLSAKRNTLLRSRYEPIVKAQEQRAKDVAMQLQSGQLDMGSVSAPDFYDAIAVQTRRDPADLVGTDGKPSRVGAAVTDIMDGLQYGNEGAMLRGANVLFEPELKIGVGEPSPHGGTIVGKQIVKFIPSPTDPSKVLPVLKVYVSNGKAPPNAAAAEEGAPPGATGYYLAPMTEHRSSDPQDAPKAIDLQQAMDYAAQMQTLSTALSHPEAAAKLEQGKKAAGSSDFLTAFYALRGKMPAKAPIEYKDVPEGHRLVGLDTRTGRPTGDVIEGPAKRPPQPTGLAANIQAVHDYAEQRGLSDEAASAELQRRGLLKSPKAAGGGGAGGSAGASDVTLTDEDATFMAEQYLRGDQSVFTNLGRGAQGARNVVKLRAAVRKAAEARGMTPDQVATAVAQFQGDKAAFRTAGTKSANIEMAAAEAGAVAELALQASAAVPRTQFMPANKAIRAYQSNTGDPAVARFGAANLALINTYARAISPTGVPTVNDKQHAEEVLSTAQSPEQYAAVVEQMKLEIKAAQESPGTVRSAMRSRMSDPQKPGSHGGPATPAPTNAKGWRLMRDAKGNQAYVSPDGKSFEEVH